VKRFAAIAVNVLLVCVFSTLGGYIAQQWPLSFAPPRHIEAESMTLYDRASGGKISLNAKTPGMWIEKNNRMIGLLVNPDSADFFLTADVGAMTGFELAMTSDAKRGSYIQFRDQNDKVSYLSKGDE